MAGFVPKPILRSRNNSVGTEEVSGGGPALSGSGNSGAGTRSSSPDILSSGGGVKSILKRRPESMSTEDLGDLRSGHHKRKFPQKFCRRKKIESAQLGENVS